MRTARSLLAAVAVACVALPAAAQAPKPGAPGASGNPLGLGSFGGKEPVTVTADRLEYDYKAGVVVYRGGVEVTQGQTKLKSDALTVKLSNTPKPDKPKDKDAGGDADAAPKPAAATPADDSARVQEIVAAGNVRIDQGERFAVGGRAIFDQTKRTLILTEDPVLHDGPNEVQGDRVIVYLDENRSVVEGGRKRVKAVLYPDQKPGEKPGEGVKP